VNTFHRPDAVPEAEKALARDVHAKLGCKDPLTLLFIQVLFVGIRIFDYKQQNYGPTNIAGYGELGVAVRQSDKVARIRNLIVTGREPADETRDDSWGDAMVYSAIALMCRWGLWPGVPAAGAPAGKVA
jgi:hypothetical protein